MNDTCCREKMARTSSVAVQHGKCGLRRLSRVGRLPRVGELYWILKDKQDLGCEKKKKGGRGFRQREQPVLRARSKVQHSLPVGMSSGKCKSFHVALAKSFRW